MVLVSGRDGAPNSHDETGRGPATGMRMDAGLVRPFGQNPPCTQEPRQAARIEPGRRGPIRMEARWVMNVTCSRAAHLGETA